MKKRLVLALLLCSTAVVPAKTVFTGKVLKHSERTWQFSYKYPEARVPGALMGVNAEMRDFNSRMQRDAQDSLREFRGEASEWKILSRHAPKSERDVTYFVMASEGLISVKFEQYQGMSEAAHPVTTVITRNFVSGRFIQLHDLFAKGSGYLTSVSQLVEEDLKRQAAAGHFELMSPAGYAPRPENFKAFGITKSGLKIFLQRDQVAAGYVGNLTCLIPWSSLEALLKPEVKDLVTRG